MYLANFSGVPYQPVLPKDYLDVLSPRAYWNLLYISYKDSPNQEDAKKLQNSDTFHLASISIEFYSILKKTHILVGRIIAFLIPLWGGEVRCMIPQLKAQKAGMVELKAQKTGKLVHRQRSCVLLPMTTTGVSCPARCSGPPLCCQDSVHTWNRHLPLIFNHKSGHSALGKFHFHQYV